MKRGHIVLIGLTCIGLAVGGSFLAFQQLISVSNSKPPVAPVSTKPSPKTPPTPQPTPTAPTNPEPEETPYPSPSPEATPSPSPTTAVLNLPSCDWKGTPITELPPGIDKIAGHSAAWTRYQIKFGNAVAGGFLPGNTVAFVPARGTQTTCAVATTPGGTSYRLQLVEFENDKRDLSQLAKDFSGDGAAEVQTETVPGASLAQVVSKTTNTKVNIVRSDDGTVLVVVASVDGTTTAEPSLLPAFFSGSGAAFTPQQ